MNHYECLGVPRDADLIAIKRAYRKRAAENHPDREGGDDELMASINRAYETLSDPAKRERYDQTGLDEAPGGVEATARAELASLFTAVLGGNFEGNPLEHMRAMIDRAQKGDAMENARDRQRLRHLEGRKNRILKKAEGGHPNLFEAIIDGHIANVKAAIEAREQRDELAQEMLKILGEYEYRPPQEESARQTAMEQMMRASRAQHWPFATNLPGGAPEF